MTHDDGQARAAYEDGRAAGRRECIAEIEALRHDERQSISWNLAVDAAIAVLRSLSLLGLPTTEREQKK